MTGPISYANQSGFYNPRTHRGHITVIGAGGIGSPTILGLGRLGLPSLSIYDNDIVDETNVASQQFSIFDVGTPKVEALKSKLFDISAAKVEANNEIVTKEHMLKGDIVISAVDSMSSRKDIFEAAMKSDIPYLIDGRLGGQKIVIHTIDLNNSDMVDYYTSEDIMFDDSEMESAPCTERAVCDVGLVVGGLIVRMSRTILTGRAFETTQMLNLENLEMSVL